MRPQFPDGVGMRHVLARLHFVECLTCIFLSLRNRDHASENLKSIGVHFVLLLVLSFFFFQRTIPNAALHVVYDDARVSRPYKTTQSSDGAPGALAQRWKGLRRIRSVRSGVRASQIEKNTRAGRHCPSDHESDHVKGMYHARCGGCGSRSCFIRSPCKSTPTTD